MEFGEFAVLFAKLEQTSKRSEKIYHISQFFLTHGVDERTILLVQGTVFSDNTNLGISTQYVIKALSTATGYSKDEITKLWSEQGDLGLVAKQICEEKRQQTLFSQTLTVEKVFENLHKLATISGADSVSQKTKLIADLLGDATKEEATYVIRFVLEVMRAGIGESTIRDALVLAFAPKFRFIHSASNIGFVPTSDGFTVEAQLAEDVREAYTLYNTVDAKDFSLQKSFACDFVWCETEQEARELYTQVQTIVQDGIDITNSVTQVAALVQTHDVDALDKLTPTLFQPIKVMLAKKAADVTQASEMSGLPCMVEYKYDGFRIQIHKSENEVQLYTRRFENVTKQFPDVVSAVVESVKEECCILDCEVVGFDPATKKYRPFQFISQRIRRKYEIERLVSELPVELNVFDVIMYGDTNMIKEQFSLRRQKLSEIITEKEFVIRISQGKECSEIPQIQELYQESLAAGNEGVMVKALNSPYKPGSRVGHMVKLKPILDTLDLVIVKASWGEGKRATWLTSFTVACIDEDGQLLEVGKVSSGLKETEGDSFEGLTKRLQPTILSQKDKEVIVKPDIIIEVAYEEIQKSSSYSSGYALRFPRIIMIRDARGVESASTKNQVEDYFYDQRH